MIEREIFGWQTNYKSMDMALLRREIGRLAAAAPIRDKEKRLAYLALEMSLKSRACEACQ